MSKKTSTMQEASTLRALELFSKGKTEMEVLCILGIDFPEIDNFEDVKIITHNAFIIHKEKSISLENN